MSFKSPGIYKQERSIVRSRRPDNAIRAAFAGRFEKGPVGTALPITDKSELIEHFGYPTDKNYNDWMQVMRFLTYYPGIYVTRVANLEHTFDECASIDVDITVTVENNYRTFDLQGANPFNISAQNINNLQTKFKQFDRFTIEGDNADNNAIYTVMDPQSFSFVPKLRYDVFKGERILKVSGVINASIEMPTEEQFNRTSTDMPNGVPANELFIESEDAFFMYKDSFAVNNYQTPLSIWARSPGEWGNGLQIAIVHPEDFRVNYSASTVKQAKQAFSGVLVDNVFRNVPQDGQIGVLVSLDNQVVEQFIVSDDKSRNDYIEHTINTKSKYIFVRRGIGPIYSTAFQQSDIKRPLVLVGGKDSEVTPEDVKKAVSIFEDKETYRVDVMIGNELDNSLSVKELARNRADFTAISGAPLSLFAVRDNISTVDNLVDFRQHIFTVDGCVCKGESDLNAQVFQDSHSVFIGQYLITYDEFNRKQRLINIAGDIAGLRCKTNAEFGEWKASAGIHRGLLNPGVRLLFNPTQPQRDIMYAHNINPVIAMNGIGNVLYGNRTMDDLNSHFSSWHVRSMTDMLLKGCQDTLRSFVMENINQYTMHSVVSSLSPLFNATKSGGGLLDYHIVCDFTNNTPETMNNNELYVDVYYRPTGVAEYICLRFNNTGSESIARVIEKEQMRRPGL